MKIAILTTTSNPAGGGISSVQYNLYSALKQRNHEAKLFCYSDTSKQSTKDIFSVKKSSCLALVLRLINFIVFHKDILKRTGAYQSYDVWFASLSSIRLFRAIRKFSPDIIILPDHGVPGYYMKKFGNAKLVHFVHHNPLRFIGNDLLEPLSVKDAERAHNYEQKYLSKIDKVISPSEYMKTYFSQSFSTELGVEVVYNFLDSELLGSIVKKDIHSILDKATDIPIINIQSAYSHYKGSSYVFEIIRRISVSYKGDIIYYLPGKIDKQLMEEFRFLPQNAILYCPGRVTWRDNVAYVKSCSLTVYPTLIDNLSMALIESIHCAVPCVTFDEGGNKEIVIDGQNGFVVDYMDIESLINQSLMLLDKTTRAQMSKNALAIARSKFSGKPNIDKLEHILNSLLDKSR